MNDCIRLDSLLPSYLAGQTSVDESEWLEHHAGGCDRCASVVESASRPTVELRRDLAPPAAVRAAVLEAVAGTTAPRARRRWFVPSAIAAGLLVAFMLIRPEPKQGAVPVPANLSAALAADRAAHDLGVLQAAHAELSRALEQSPGDQRLEAALGRLESQRRSLEALVREFAS